MTDATAAPLAIEVSPAQTDLIVDVEDLPSTVHFTATAIFADGRRRDVSDEVDWLVDNSAPGQFIAGGQWQSSNVAGGAVEVVARIGPVEGAGDIRVLLRATVLDSEPATPDDAPARFARASTPVTETAAGAPAIIYPPHQVMFPRNLVGAHVEVDAELDLYRFHFSSEFLDLQVFSTRPLWRADPVSWSWLADTLAGGRVDLRVSGIQTADPDLLYRSAARQIYVSRTAIDGAIYFGGGVAGGVHKAVLSETSSQLVDAVGAGDGEVTCQSLSRDGTRMVAAMAGHALSEIGLPGGAVLIAPDAGHEASWTAFSPAGDRLLVAHRGLLTLLDADTGQPLGGGDGVVDLGGLKATHPDWSPRGDRIAVALCAEVDDLGASECGIATLRVQADGLVGAEGLEVLVEAGVAGAGSSAYPRFSADGRWIVYTHSAGDPITDGDAELRLIPAVGGPYTSWYMPLTRASHRVGMSDGVMDTASTMPSWAPSTGPGTQWLIFSSTRAVGSAEPPGQQLWAVGVELDVAASHIDPSYAAFWLPQQPVGASNYRPIWSNDAAVACTGSPEVCDGFDSDCNGLVDDGCTDCQSGELCGDGLDNDCDGLIDELCPG